MATLGAPGTSHAGEPPVMLGEVHATVRQVLDVRSQVDQLRAKATSMADVTTALGQFDEGADSVLNQLYEPKAKSGNDLINYPMRSSVRIAYLEDEVDYGDGAPTTQFRQMATEYRAALDTELARWKAIIDKELPALNRLLGARGLPAVSVK